MKTLDSSAKHHPIGIFDSGVGGLTVAAALRRRLPGETLLYLGDIARLPYGTKSPETVVRYALNAAAFLVGRGIKMLVVACNTASAHALAAVQEAYPGLPVLGVVAAGAAAAARLSRSGRIVVAATEGTCRSGAFARAIAGLRPGAEIAQIPCPMFVALAEEGLIEGPIAEDMARHYLGTLFHGPRAADTLVLGCTHFPLLAPTLRKVLGDGTVMVDCAQAVAEEAAALLARGGIAARNDEGGIAARNDEGGRAAGNEDDGMAASGEAGGMHLVATDAPDRFARMAGRFFPGLGEGPDVELVNL